MLMREQASSLYSVTPYFFAKVLAEIPFSLIYPIPMTLLIYWLIPLNGSSSAFIIFCTLWMIICYSHIDDSVISSGIELCVVGGCLCK